MKFTITMYCKPLVHRLWEKINVTLPLDLDREIEAKAFEELEPHTYYTVEIKKVQDQKTLSQNAYAWRMISDIAKYERANGNNVDKNEVYRGFVRDQGQCDIIHLKKAAGAKFKASWELNGTGWQVETIEEYEDTVELMYYYGMKAWDKKEMSDFIEKLQRECIDRNISVERF